MAMAQRLGCRRKATDGDALDHAPPVKSRSGKNPVRPICHSIHAVTFLVKSDSVNVHLKPGTIGKHEICLASALLNLKAPTLENLTQSRNVTNSQDNVNVLVRSCLRTERRINGPAAI